MPIWKAVVLGGLLVAVAAGRLHSAPADAAGIEFFESKIRPVLSSSCYKCHSANSDKLRGHLQLDSREGMLKGGDSGPAIVPGDPDKSLLVKAIHREDPDMAMPPKEKLSDAAVADLSSWIRRGAPWPAEAAPKSVAPARPAMDFDKARREHWAFQPLHGVTAPEVKDKAWAKSPIDAFILQKLEASGLKPAPPADKATLLRRIFLDLIGLPPTPEEQKKFLEDSSPDRIEKVIDDLLSRPQYGERWGRHWLDIARFAETQGYERDEPKASAWRYRDYVIKSFNDDKPYDRFVTEQLAGDEIENSTIETQIGTSFLRVGTIDTIAADGKLARYDQLDDILGTTASAFLGQTLRCARCHDHKFEPFAQTDYYKLMCVFEPLKEDVGKDAPVGGEAEKAALREAKAQVDKEIIPIQAQLDELRASVLDRVEEELKKEQETSVDSAGEKKESKDGGKDKKPDANKKDRKPVPPEALAALHKPASERSKQEQDLVNSNHDRIEREARHGADEKEKAEIARIDKQINDLKARPLPGTRAYVFREEGKNPGKGRVFIRGDCHRDGPEVTVGIPTVLGGDSVAPPTPTAATSGRRLWLAKWMTGPGSPLLARVMANRIWQHHFGRGIVATPNDFGTHGDPPTHPELLEYLANEFAHPTSGSEDSAWRIKRLHKLIILSSTYQQSAAHLANDADPEDRLLSHWHTHRLEAEAIRDSILAASGKLNLAVGGPSVYPPLSQKVVGDSAGLDWGNSDERQASRRSVYVFVKRSIALPELEVMGLADSAGSCDQRAVATTALQSLMLLNSKFVWQQAEAFSQRVQKEAGEKPEDRVRAAFIIALCREPRLEEFEHSLQFLKTRESERTPGGPSSLAQLCLVLLNTNEFVYSN